MKPLNTYLEIWCNFILENWEFCEKDSKIFKFDTNLTYVKNILQFTWFKFSESIEHMTVEGVIYFVIYFRGGSVSKKFKIYNDSWTLFLSFLIGIFYLTHELLDNRIYYEFSANVNRGNMLRSEKLSTIYIGVICFFCFFFITM